MYTTPVIWFLIFFPDVRWCKGPRAPFRHRRTFYFFALPSIDDDALFLYVCEFWRAVQNIYVEDDHYD